MTVHQLAELLSRCYEDEFPSGLALDLAIAFIMEVRRHPEPPGERAEPEAGWREGGERCR